MKTFKQYLTEQEQAKFSFVELSKLNTYKSVVEYCNSTLQKLGSGSARIVYKLNDTSCLKVAKNSRGIAQNEVEQPDYLRDESGCFVKVLDSDDQRSLWVKAEIAIKATKSIFKTYFGITFEEFVQCLEKVYKGVYIKQHGAQAAARKYITQKQDYQQVIEQMPAGNLKTFLEHFWYYQADYNNPIINDYKSLRNWGVVNRNGIDTPVIIDIGFNDDVQLNYYSSEPRKVRRLK